jgi:hypothetical protein
MNETIREGFVDATPVESPVPAQQPQTVDDVEALAWRCPITIKLRRKSIVGNNGEQLTELTFREPTGGDIVRHGNPVHIDREGEFKIDEKKMTAMMGQLSGVLAPLLHAMHPVDWNTCADRLAIFFVPDRRYL